MDYSKIKIGGVQMEVTKLLSEDEVLMVTSSSQPLITIAKIIINKYPITDTIEW